MSNTNIVWEKPPSQQRQRKGVWVDRLQPLMENPGEWARVYEGSLGTARSTSNSLRSGKTQIPDGDWEFVSRKIDEDTGGIWAVYWGEDDEMVEEDDTYIEDEDDVDEMIDELDHLDELDVPEPSTA